MQIARARVLVAVEGELVRHALAELIRNIPEFSFRGAMGDAATVVATLRSRKLDVVLLDVALAEKRRLLFADIGMQQRLLLVSPRRHIGLDSAWLADYACGFVRERAPLKHLEMAARLVAQCDVLRAGSDPRCLVCPLRPTLQPSPLPLTRRECGVFARIGLGNSNQVIAGEMSVSVKTVEAHRENIKRKLGIGGAAQLAAAAVSWRMGEFSMDIDAQPDLERGGRKTR